MPKAILRIPFPAATAALLAACGSVPKRTFEIHALSAEERPVPCLVVVDDDWIGAADRNQFVNLPPGKPLSLEIVFERGEVEVAVAPILVNLDTGAPDWVPRRRSDENAAVRLEEELRQLRPTDPQRQLFLLPLK